MKLIQVAGYSNSGKTTLIEKLVKNLNEKNKRVSVIKHHGHNKCLVELDTGKDSAKFREAGAVGTTVVAGNTVQIHFENESNWSVSDALTLQKFFNIDVVIIEGFKKERFPKVVIIRREEDLELLDQLENILVILKWDNIKWDRIKLQKLVDVPIFSIEDFELFSDWFFDHILKEDL